MVKSLQSTKPVSDAPKKGERYVCESCGMSLEIIKGCGCDEHEPLSDRKQTRKGSDGHAQLMVRLECCGKKLQILEAVSHDPLTM